MAALNYYLSTAVTGTGWRELSSSPIGDTTLADGWIVGTGSTNHSEYAVGVERAESTFTGTTVPDGTLDTSLLDAFKTEADLTGSFASGDWVFHFVVRADTDGGAQDGRVRFRLFKADENGANATEITSGQQQASLVSNVTNAADFDSTLTVNLDAFTILHQRLFLQIAWERTGAGGAATSDIHFRTGNTSAGTRIVTADFKLPAQPTFCCGFECGDAGTMAAHWSSASGTPSIETTIVRSAARALRCNPTSALEYVTGVGVHFSSTTRHVARAYLYFVSLPDTSTGVLTFAGNSAGPQARFNQSDSKIYAAVGTTLGSTGVTITTGRWYRIDYDFNVDVAGADFCDVQVDGIACGQATGTGVSGGSNVDGLGLTTSCTADVIYDDFVASSTAVDYPLGAGYIHPFRCDQDGAHNISGTGDFQRGNTGVDILNATTNAYLLIDDLPLPSGTVDQADCWRAVAPAVPATDYVEARPGPALGGPRPSRAPRAVEVVLVYHQIATQVGQMQVLLEDNGTTDVIFDTGAAAGVTTYRYARKHYANPPSAASVWVVTAGNGNFNGIHVRFRAPDANPDQCLDAVLIEAEFAGEIGGAEFLLGGGSLVQSAMPAGSDLFLGVL